jgi:glutamyl-tRNA(Gln) amidotransferase subunit D
MDYSEKIEKALEHAKVKVGDHVVVEKDQIFEGTIMPNTGDPDVLVLKLNSGYNIGIDIEGAKIKKVEKEKKPKAQKQHYEQDPGKKTILILHTGGTIASKIDYETGGVKAAITPEEIITLVPDLKNIANIKTEIVFQMASDDIGPDHWKILAKKISEEFQRADGFIITHGTDTMHYTSAALSFMLKGIPKPVILVGSRSLS